ncbi:MAG: YkgJ family cysteine cluster protein [Candidatus Sumerlaeaceae bacterium]
MTPTPDRRANYELKEFVCARCGNCCRGEGIVRVKPDEAMSIAAFLGLSLDEFYAHFTRDPEDPGDAQQGIRWLIDKPGPLRECIFLDGNLCRVHPVKPERCRAFPLAWRTPDILDYCVGMQQ